MLFTLLGRGCEEVTRVDSADATVVACRWKDGRIGTMRALRPYSDYGVVSFLKNAKGFTSQSTAVKTSSAELDRQVVAFFTSGVPPVPNEDTLELMAFMDAAQRSKAAGGQPMRLR